MRQLSGRWSQKEHCARAKFPGGDGTGRSAHARYAPAVLERRVAHAQYRGSQLPAVCARAGLIAAGPAEGPVGAVYFILFCFSWIRVKVPGSVPGGHGRTSAGGASMELPPPCHLSQAIWEQRHCWAPPNRPLNLCKRLSIHSIPCYAQIPALSLPRRLPHRVWTTTPISPRAPTLPNPRSAEAALPSRGTLGIGVLLGGAGWGCVASSATWLAVKRVGRAQSGAPQLGQWRWNTAWVTRRSANGKGKGGRAGEGARIRRRGSVGGGGGAEVRERGRGRGQWGPARLRRVWRTEGWGFGAVSRRRSCVRGNEACGWQGLVRFWGACVGWGGNCRAPGLALYGGGGSVCVYVCEECGAPGWGFGAVLRCTRLYIEVMVGWGWRGGGSVGPGPGWGAGRGLLGGLGGFG